MVYADIKQEKVPPRITLTTAWNEKELVKQIPGSAFKDNQWSIPATWSAVTQLHNLFPETLHVSETLTDWIWELREKFVLPSLQLREATEPTQVGTTDYYRRLFLFQQACVEFKHAAGSGILGDDMGCGKTIETLAYLRSLGEAAFPALVICPNAVKDHWATQADHWFPEATTYVIDGTAAIKRKKLDAAKKDSRALVIINIEATRTFSMLDSYPGITRKQCVKCDKYRGDDSVTATTCQTHPKALNAFPWKVVIVDEAHRLKNPKSQQTRAVWALSHAPTVEHVWALTGTPIANHIGDLWAILHTISAEEFPNKSKFIDRYGLISWNPFGGLDIVGLNPANKQEFYTIFFPRYRRMRKDTVLPQLPPKVHTMRMVDLTPTQRRMANEISSSSMCRDQNGDLVFSPSNLTAAMRLTQLACGTIKITNKPDPDNPSTWEFEIKEPSSKVDELLHVIEELGDRQAVIAVQHTRIATLIESRFRSLDIPYAKITGEVSVRDRTRALTAFDAKQVNLLLITTGAGGTGLDMSAASCLIWFEYPTSMVEYLQTEDRICRIGSERHSRLDVVHIVARDTIEQNRAKRLEEKLLQLYEITEQRRLTTPDMTDEIAELDEEISTIVSSYL